MIFSSLQYLLFLPIVVFLYWRTRGGARLTLVVVASYIFYMSWLPVYGLLLLALTVANWGLALVIAKASQKPFKRLLLWLGLVLNVGCLCYYKYTNFILQNLAAAFNSTLHLAQSIGAASQISSWNVSALQILLPLGISFFVFEFVHYLVEVYKGNVPTKSFLQFAAFAAYFPSQIAGPIKRYQDFNNRLHQPEPWSSTLFFEAMGLIVQGLFKKVALADPIGGIIFPLFHTIQAYSSWDALLAIIGFYIQVYCDFSGYTDIGRGSALLMGIRLPENFNLPYLSEDIGEFWRRWHMSLSFWLRDYVYIPLGGSRDGKLAQSRNLFITMVVCGLWHGASWHYVIYGATQGLGLIVNRQWQARVRKSARLKLFGRTTTAKLLGTAATVCFVALTYVIFRAPDLPRAINVFSNLLRMSGSCTLLQTIEKTAIVPLLMVYLTFWLTLELCKRRPHFLSGLTNHSPAPLCFITPVRLAAWTAAAILMVGAHPSEAIPFVYFQF